MQSSHIRGSVLATVVVLLFGAGTATTSASPIPPVPAPTVAPAPPLDDGPTATITFADATQIKAQTSRSGRFQLVGLHPREVINIAFDFPATLTGVSVTAQPLDGGKIIGPPKDVGKGPQANSIRFQVGDQPGLYRVFITGGRSRSTLQFWVADTKKPKNNRPVLNPGH